MQYAKSEPYKAAQEYLKNSWSVIPVGQTDDGSWKKPLVKGWQKYSNELPTEEDIRGWWDEWPNAQVGLVCGEASSLMVLDVDGEEGKESLSPYMDKIPPTVSVATGGGGIHYYFQLPDPDEVGFVLGNTVGKVGKGLDIRATRGFVVAPPSLTILSNSSYATRPFQSVNNLFRHPDLKEVFNLI